MKKTGKKSARKTPVALRPVTPEDEGFLYEVYASTRAAEMAQVNWSGAQKENFLRMQFNLQYREYRARFGEAGHRIILLGDRPVGRIWVARLPEEFRLVDLAVLPEEGNAGVGTTLVQDLLAEAAEAGKPVRLMTLQNEAGLLMLFKGLGFRVVGESGIRYLMEWLPPQRDDATQRSD